MSNPSLRVMAARAQVIRLHHNGEPDSEVFRMAVDDLIKAAKNLPSSREPDTGWFGVYVHGELRAAFPCEEKAHSYAGQQPRWGRKIEVVSSPVARSSAPTPQEGTPHDPE